MTNEQTEDIAVRTRQLIREAIRLSDQAGLHVVAAQLETALNALDQTLEAS